MTHRFRCRLLASLAIGLVAVLATAAHAQSGQDWAWLSASRVAANDSVTLFVAGGAQPFAWEFESYEVVRNGNIVGVGVNARPAAPGVVPRNLVVPLGSFAPGAYRVNVVLWSGIDPPPVRQLTLQVDPAATAVPVGPWALVALALAILLLARGRVVRRS